MASVTCTLCNTENAILACHDCKTLVCNHCSSTCSVCRISICTKHTKQTKSGSKMCIKCMAEREARRKVLQHKYKNPSLPTAPKSSIPTAPPTASTSFSSLDDSPVAPAPIPGTRYQSTSLDDLTGGEQLLRATAVPDEDEDEPQSEREDDVNNHRIPEEERTEAFFTETGRLELPPMDQNRPILGASGYQSPSKTSFIIAFILFGLAMIYTVRAVPALEDTLFPFSTHTTEFNEGQMLIIQDTNAIRDGGNIQGLDIMAQGATFFVAWAFVLSYFGGMILLIFAMIRSAIWSRRSKTQREAMEGLSQNSKDLYL